MSCFTLFGVAYSFGAFFRPMGMEFGASRMPTAVVFSITAGIYNALGAPAGHLSDRYGPRPVLLAAAFFMGTGLILTSRIDRLWMGYLTYGLGVGLGGACCYVPMVSVVGGWFARWRNTALGISVAGIGCGTLAMAPIAAALIERYGWRETYVILGVASAIILVICALVVEPPPIHLQAARPRLSAAVRTPHFAMLWVASLLASIAIYVPFVYLPEFAQHQGVSRVAAATLVGIIGGASVVGRMGLGVVADRTGIMWLYKLCTLALGLSYAVWILTSGYGWLLVFALTMGTAYGGLVALATRRGGGTVRRAGAGRDAGNALHQLGDKRAGGAAAGGPRDRSFRQLFMGGGFRRLRLCRRVLHHHSAARRAARARGWSRRSRLIHADSRGTNES